MVRRGGPGSGRDDGLPKRNGKRRRREPVEQCLFGQTRQFRRQQHIQRMAKHMGIGRLDVKLVLVVQIHVSMRHMGHVEFTATAHIMRMVMKRGADQVKGHQQEQQPTTDQRPPGWAL